MDRALGMLAGRNQTQIAQSNFEDSSRGSSGPGTMTVGKHHHFQARAASLTEKGNQVPKKAVTVKKAVKFAQTAASIQAKVCGVDTGLQGDKRRKYMRRGSKTPAMLLISSTLNFENFMQDRSEASSYRSEPLKCEYPTHPSCFQGLSGASTLSSFPDFQSMKECSGCELDSLNGELTNKINLTQPRRLSMMSALMQNMEKASISATAAPRKETSPRRRRFSFDLVM